MYWYVLYVMVCTGMYLHVMEPMVLYILMRIGFICVYCCVLACIVCIRGICTYWSVLVSICPTVLQRVCTIGIYWEYLYVFACFDVCYCVFLRIACISMYRVNWPVAPQECILICLPALTWRYLHVLVYIVCIDLYCLLWYVLIKVLVLTGIIS